MKLSEILSKLDKETSNKIKSVIVKAQTEEIHDAIINYIWENPNPKDKTQIHELAKTFNMEPGKFEEYVYQVLTSLIHLKGSEVPDDKFDKDQLAKGIEIEKEHHDHLLVRKNIAKIHLKEAAKYYIGPKGEDRIKIFEEEGK